MGLEIGADLQGISQDHRATLGNQLLPGIGRAAYGTTLVAMLSLRAGVGVDLLVRQGASERLMTREALRSRQSDAFGAGGIAGDRPTKCGVDRPVLKHALGVIYLSAAPSHNQRRRSALPSVRWYLIVHAGSPRQGLAKQFTNAPSQKGTQHEASLPPRLDDQPNC